MIIQSTIIVDDDEEANMSCFSLLGKKLKKTLPLPPFYLSLELKTIDKFPIEDKTILNKSYFNFRQYSGDFYEAASYSFFEKVIENRNLGFIDGYLRNCEEYNFLRILPKDQSLKNCSATKLAQLEVSRKEFLEIFQSLREELGKKEKNCLTILTNFYSNRLNEKIHHFFKIFLRGYILARLLRYNDWKHLKKSKNFSEKLGKIFDLEAKSVSLADLLTINNYSEYKIGVLRMNNDGTCIERRKISTESIKDELFNSFGSGLDITLLEYKGKFFNLYQEFQYEILTCDKCGESFEENYLISCDNLNKHSSCAQCLSQKTLRNHERCSIENCEAKINIKELRRFCEKNKISLEAECIVCKKNTKPNPNSKENLCEECKHFRFFEKNCTECQAPMKKGQVFQQLQQFYCKKEECHSVFCNQCHEVGKNILLCKCFCKDCGELLPLSGKRCENCEKMCYFCKIVYSNEELLYRKCEKCQKKTCRNCWIAFCQENNANYWEEPYFCCNFDQ